ncbi:ABC transporter ATP-binding protein [Pigmentiphaga soli]
MLVGKGFGTAPAGMAPDAAGIDGAAAGGTGKVEISNVSIAFKGPGNKLVPALAPTDLILRPGEFAAFIGPSGCGKSTLMNAVAGFVVPTTGGIVVDGVEIRKPTPDIGVVFQNFALFPWFTAIANVEFPLKRFGLTRAQRRERAFAALEEVGLARHAEKYPGQLSGGMKQRVAIARTLVSNPALMLMDEPFGALDAQTKVTMHELLLRLWERRRQTVMFVTHDVNEALVLADVVYVMSAAPGRIIERIEVDSPRPRSAEHIDEGFVRRRAAIMKLLRNEPHAEED